MDFVEYLGLHWPDESTRLFTVSVAEVQAFRDQMVAESKAPKTINRRIASLSSFFHPARRRRRWMLFPLLFLTLPDCRY